VIGRRREAEKEWEVSGEKGRVKGWGGEVEVH